VLAGAGALAALLAKPAIGDGLSFAEHPAHAALVSVGLIIRTTFPVTAS